MAFGGEVVRASEVIHGKISPIYHQQTGLFQALPSLFPPHTLSFTNGR